MPISRRRFILRSMEGAAGAVFLAHQRPALSDAPLRLGLVGLGERGASLLEALPAYFPSIDLRAICDRDPAALHHAAGFLKTTTRLFDDVAPFLREAPIDAVAVAAPNGMSLGRRALSSGRHVFLMTPAGRGRQETARTLQLARERGLRLGAAPYDLSWNADEFDVILRSAGPVLASSMVVSLRGAPGSAKGTLWPTDVLANAAAMVDHAIPDHAAAVATRTPWGNSWAVSFRMPGGAAVDVRYQPDPSLQPGALAIEAVFDVNGGKTHVFLDSMLTQPTGPAAIPCLAGFLVGSPSSPNWLLWKDLLDEQTAHQWRKEA